MSNEPKACAHCGGDHIVEEWRRLDDRTDDWTMWKVMCGKCGVSTDWHGTREAAIATWNTRADDTLQEQVDSLTAERDELRDKLDEKQHVCRDRYEDDIAELTAERDEWKTKCETREVAYKQADAERKRYSEQIDELFSERDELRDKLADALEQVDSLTAELKHKQDVCDVQRESFLKLEAENRELQDVCGELERTIENMRGME